MNKSLSKIALAATLGLALALTFSCSDSKDNDGGGNAAQSSCPNVAAGVNTVACGGKIYRTVEIGGQVWMAENLNYAVDGSKCYDDLESNCDQYGRLYNWATAMGLEASCNSSSCASQISAKHRGICPENWHIPSKAEWDALATYIESDKGGLFPNAGSDGSWWSATEYDGSYAYLRDVSYYHEYAYWLNINKSYLFSVRCLQDNPGSTWSSPSAQSSSSGGSASSNSALRECEAMFNPDNKFCYDGTVYDKCDGKEYSNPADKFCYNLTVYDKCGGQEYSNPGNKFCYDGTVYEKCSGLEYSNPADKFCYDGTVYDRCGGLEYSNPGNKFCYDGTAYEKCDGIKYDPSIYICSGGVATPAKCNGKSYNPLTHYCKGGTAVVDYGFVTHGGETYKTVVIGEQVWMAENLNSILGGCYNNKESNCEKYGRLYDVQINWRTVCPSGWHLPSNAEWQKLVDFAGGNEIAGKKLKATSEWSRNGTDDFGFSALPGGYRDEANNFSTIGDCGHWFSMSFYYDGNGFCGDVFPYWSICSGDDARWENSSYGGGSFSVRCVQD